MQENIDSPLRRLADHLLDNGLEDFIRGRRDAGRSWRLVARDLYDATDGAVDVTTVTLTNWFPALTASAKQGANGDAA
jgi:hypothetical protein